jgi:hypothetical protein
LLSVTDHPVRRTSEPFSVTFGFAYGGIPIIANVFDGGYEGYSIKAAFWPSPYGEKLDTSKNPCTPSALMIH